MKNYKLGIQYDGTGYAGWQIQNNAVTVQQVIKEKLQLILRQEEINLTGSGRTDAGVHALGQRANFFTEEIKDQHKFLYSLNSVLPKDISVVSVKEVSEDFSARFSARQRSYFYILNSVKSPFFEKYSWLDSRFAELDINVLNSISNIFLGIHDFTSFSKKNSEIENKQCEVFNIRWRRKGPLILFFIEANRFLHGMVRTIIGTILKSLNQDNPEKYIEGIFTAASREAADESVSARGLFLYKVKY